MTRVCSFSFPKPTIRNGTISKTDVEWTLEVVRIEEESNIRHTRHSLKNTRKAFNNIKHVMV